MTSTSDPQHISPQRRETSLPDGRPSFDPAAVLAWYRDCGVDTVESAEPGDLSAWAGPPRSLLPDATERPRQPPTAPLTADPTPHPAAGRGPAPVTASDAPMPKDEAVALATELAKGATTITDLAQAIADYKGCPLHAGAKQAVVYDGVVGAPLLIMGEAPGRDEDREGRPFVGRSGQLLDRMLAAIGASRRPGDDLEDVLISNAIYWRPPGNRTPTKAEIATCLPFMHRFIALARPKVLVLTGNVPTQALYKDAPGITRSRGKWRRYDLPDGTDVPVLPIYHPAFLLRQPIQKRLAWQDLQAAKAALDQRS